MSRSPEGLRRERVPHSCSGLALSRLGAFCRRQALLKALSLSKGKRREAERVETWPQAACGQVDMCVAAKRANYPG